MIHITDYGNKRKLCYPEKVEYLKEKVDETNGMSKLFKVLADDNRLKIIYALTHEKELCVCDIAGILDSTTQRTSYHLRLLAELGFCNYRKEGKIVYYSLEDDNLPNTVKNLIDQELEKEAN